MARASQERREIGASEPARAALDPALESWILTCVAPRLAAPPESVHLDVERRDDRRWARMTWLRAIGPHGALDLVLKQLFGSGDALTGPNRLGRSGETRPRITTRGTFGERYALEYTALRQAEGQLQAVGDDRLVAVPALGYLPDAHALLLERVRASNLRDVIQRSMPRPRRGPPDLERAIANAGTWLRTYHGIPVDDLRNRHAERSDVVELIGRLCGFLGRNLPSQPYFHDLAGRLEVLATTALPPQLPLGLAHGDFAPRNVLVLSGARVAVIDMAGGTAIPIYEDLGYFLASIRTSVPRIATGGALLSSGTIDRWERLFLEAYFAPRPVPWSAIRLYETLVILDKWWGTPPRLATSPRGRVMARIGGGLVDRFFRSEIARLLRSVDLEAG